VVVELGFVLERHLVAGDLEVEVEVDPQDLVATAWSLEGSSDAVDRAPQRNPAGKHTELVIKDERVGIQRKDSHGRDPLRSKGWAKGRPMARPGGVRGGCRRLTSGP
jgi:hypothetical protein